MKKIIKKILLSLLLSVIPLAMFLEQTYDFWILTVIIIMIFMLWTVNIDTISNLSFDVNRKKFELNRNVEKTKKIADEVQVTAKTFNKTIKAFMNFNLADLQIKGLFKTMDWKDAAKFVNESRDLSATIDDTDQETVLLIVKSKCKVIDMFKDDATKFFTDQKVDIDKYISSGVEPKEDCINYDSNRVAIDFEGLYNLTDQVSENNKLLWKKELSDLDEFYRDNFKR